MGAIIHTHADPEPSLASDPEPSLRVVEAVAHAKDIDPLECPPLYECIDPSALDELFDGKKNPNGCTMFEYAGYVVMIDSGGTVTLLDLD